MKENINNNLVLIGFMGSGKTSVAVRLSFLLKRAMTDTDTLIERREGCPVSEIFAARGEEYFREAETALLGDIAGTMRNHILAVGGGTPLREENRLLLKKIGLVVWLRVKPETVWKRLHGDTTRPLLAGDDPYGTICRLIRERESLYAQAADAVIDVDEISVSEVSFRIAALSGADQEG